MPKLRDLKYVLAFLGPVVAFLGVHWLGIWSWGVVLLEFALIPVFEFFHSGRSHNVDEKEERRLNQMKWFDFLLYINLPILYFLVYLNLWTISFINLSLFEMSGLTLSLGIIIGTIGINIAHELGHRKSKFDQWMARLLLIPGWYCHFTIEHNLGHHKYVATEEDPSSARKNESIYFFWVRSVFGVYRGAWKIETDRLNHLGLSFLSLHNNMILATFLQLIYAFTVFFFFGMAGLIFVLFSGIIGFLLLESVNYIEHYGLVRFKMPSGVYERVNHRHSWNSNHELGRIFLFELTRHSDHHYQANKKYQILRNDQTSPQLPLGYPGSILLALVPWAWFRKMNKILPLLLLITGILHGKSYEVGAGQTYPTPASLSSANVLAEGDTVFIHRGEYRGRDALANWRPDRLVIIGDVDRPQLFADGQYILGKGIWVCAGDNITVVNIEFYDAVVPDKNGAGIRLDGVGLTINQCHFENNENGILTSNPGSGKVDISNSSFIGNGHGDGFSHNLYIGRIDTLIFECNISVQCTIGHQLKTRAKWNYIHANHLADGNRGESSRLIDISNGGQSFVSGNSLTQGPRAQNNNLFGYGLEGLYDQFPHQLIISNNTLINYRSASHVFIDLPNNMPDLQCVVINNFFGGGTLISRDSISLFDRNIINQDPSDFQFQDISIRDYRLTSQSPGIDSGRTIRSQSGQFLPLPTTQFTRDESCEERKVDGLAIDIGAFEFKKTTSLAEEEVSFQVYPNPVTTELMISRTNDLSERSIFLFNQNGQKIYEAYWGKGSSHISIDVHSFPSGMFFWKVLNTNGQGENGKVIIR